MDRGNSGEAVSHYREALRIRPHYAGAINNLGLVFLHNGDYEEAAIAFRKTIELFPTRALPHYNLSLALYRLGRTEEALTECVEAVRLMPHHAPAQEHLKRLRGESGNAGGAG